jgi:hypothetical protein
MMNRFTDDQVFSIDFETDYDSKGGYSLTCMTTDQYCSHPRFNPYLVAIAGKNLFPEGTPTPGYVNGIMMSEDKDGIQLFVGHPRDFKWWDRLNHHILAIHNAAFDERVIIECVRRGIIPNVLDDVEYMCTADLSAYLMCKRSLKDSMKYLFGKEISKAVRSGMDGRTTSDLTEKEYRDLVEYGGSDAIECLQIWNTYSSEFPEIERQISKQKREASIRGVHVDREYCEAALKELKRYHAEVVCDIPWYPEKAVGSLPALRQAVIALGIEPPKSFKKDDPGFLAWIERPTAQYDEAVRRGYKIIDDFYEDVRHAEVRENPGMAGSPTTGRERILHRAYTERRHLAHIEPAGELAFLSARQKAVAINMHAARVEGILNSLDENGDSHPQFLYYGAHTGRDSGKSSVGGGNVNMLNMPRKPVLAGDEHVFGGKGVDIRSMYVARPGYKFVIYDFAQIEARFSLWLVNDEHMMAAIKDEGNLYGAAAVMMGWCPPHSDIKHKDPDLYRLAKCATLGLGYGMGAAKFVDSCKSQGLDLPSVPVAEWPELDRRLTFIIRNVARIKGDPYAEYNRTKVGQLVRALQIVNDWRSANHLIVDQWKFYEATFKQRVAAGKKTVAFKLPSGRIKRYYDPHLCKEETTEIDENGVEHPSFRIAMKATTVRGNPATFFTGGSIMENVVQATCRDIMAFSAVEIERKHPSWRYVFSVYDEIVFEVPDAETDEASRVIPETMCHGEYIRDWTDGLMLEVEGGVAERYHK